MANLAWYNDNQFRDYPFLNRTEPITFGQQAGFSSSSSSSSSDSGSATGLSLHLPHSVVVDFGAIMEIDAEYTEAAGHYVYLHSVSRSGSTFTFKMRTTAPEGENHQLIFTRELTDEEFLIEWEDSSSIVAEPVDPLTCPLQPRWKGFFVSGNLEELGTLLGDGEEWVFLQGLWQVEPARIQSLMDSYLRAVSLANYPRLRVNEPVGCESSSSSGADEDGTPIISAECIIGDIKWKEGFNCVIRQDVTDNAIIIGAGVGVGAGEPCEEVPLFDGEAPPEGSPHLSGGPGCHEIVKSINGVVGSNVLLTAGPGFRVQPHPVVQNRLVVNKSLEDFALCLEDDTIVQSSSSLSESTPSSASGGD